ncbi:3-dehydroquinate synthase [Pedobacter sp. HDW13]|uniref:3-dehydroquinate synthase n=1 Tax=unclassified Pedobacter TaxID=2628915 RepID=UPI000F59CF99|nr:MULTISPECIES: 3-dehydroquinate synthase [unclassified Pedobacter]QIL41693.1 3-dehydroquinate synthase [Pedobacter sp. HDW13]RQO73529.1 3-dehydroquinate synthase [Pedobacter sp. KBW01]
MEHLQQSFTVQYNYNIFFTSALFAVENKLFSDFLSQLNPAVTIKKILFVIDEGVAEAHTALTAEIKQYFNKYNQTQLVQDIIVIPGGELVKNDTQYLERILEAINTHGIDRHSFVAAIGGGAVLDMVGYAATIAHRGIKHIRIPSTVLSQNDSGVGVKNGINYFNKKNFLGTFSPPVAVFNDELFLNTLSDRDWRSGIAEAIKVALIKDLEFFEWLEANATALAHRDREAMNYQIWKCAKLHLEHIRSADPFENGSARPLDFGHWSAHKLEYLTNFEIRHGEAVAMGIALDAVYSNLSGRISAADSQRVIAVIQALGFELTHPLLQVEGDNSPILQGLEEFREHLGGQLTITLLTALGKGEEVHEIDAVILKQAAESLQNQAAAHSTATAL